MAGLGSREINVDSPDEVALARSLGTCDTGANVSARFDLLLLEERDLRQAVTERLSRAYEGTLFRSDAPSEPASNAEIVLAVVVLLPEIVALVVGLATVTKWQRVEWIGYGVAGLGDALTSIISLAIIVGEADALRAAAICDVLHVNFVGHTDVAINLSGSRLLLSETLFVVARRGFRKTLLVGLAAELSVGTRCSRRRCCGLPSASAASGSCGGRSVRR